MAQGGKAGPNSTLASVNALRPSVCTGKLVFQTLLFAAALLLCCYFALDQDLNVFGYGLPGGVKMLGKAVGRHGLQGEQADDGAAGRIGYSLKNISSHIFNWQLFGCKYKCNFSVAQEFLKIIWGKGNSRAVKKKICN